MECAMGPIFHMISNAPDPVAPISHAVEVDNWVFVTSQMSFTDMAIQAPYSEGIEPQTLNRPGS
jgi:2-iminobutanoate/2-iminopropanoate deaminase